LEHGRPVNGERLGADERPVITLRSERRRALATGLALVAGALLTSAAPAAAGGDEDAVLTPAAFEVLNPPEPVLGADGQNHLAYEIRVANQSAAELTIAAVQARSAGKPIGAEFSGESLALRMRFDRGGNGTTIGPGEGALVFMDVTYPRKAKRPARLEHRIDLSYINPEPGSTARTASFTGVPTPVSRATAIEVEPPLSGPRWLVGSGCCDDSTSHRGATLAIDGTVHVPERFAIDFVQLDPEHRMYSGPLESLSSYAFFGHPLRSATDGKVVRVQDGLPEQVPGSLPADATVQTAGGNYVVVRADRGHYAFYAHMQPGSLRVERGDQVEAGQVLGLLGNSGNTDGPHLHFHIMDSPSPLQSNGLPFTFSRFRGDGVVASLDPLFLGIPAPLEPADLAGKHRDELPLDRQMIAFPGR
jgi:hypothetical protein